MLRLVTHYGGGGGQRYNPDPYHSYCNHFSVNVAGCKIPLADHIRILGVTLDKNLSTDNHVRALSESIHYHIRASRHIRSYISEDLAKMVACALCMSALAVTMQILYYMAPIRKTLPNCLKHKTSLHVSCH